MQTWSEGCFPSELNWWQNTKVDWKSSGVASIIKSSPRASASGEMSWSDDEIRPCALCMCRGSTSCANHLAIRRCPSSQTQTSIPHPVAAAPEIYHHERNKKGCSRTDERPNWFFQDARDSWFLVSRYLNAIARDTKNVMPHNVFLPWRK